MSDAGTGGFVCRCGETFNTAMDRGLHRLRTKACQMTQEERAATKREARRRWNRHHRDQYNAIQRAYRQTATGRLHVSATTALYHAVATGRIIRQPCEVCGAEPADGHHAFGYDPANWLRVRWLCQTHHQEAHRAAA